MWKSTAGASVNVKKLSQDDDWETDPDFVNEVSEEEQRWGSKTVEGSGRKAGAVDVQKIREETEAAEITRKKKELAEGPNASFGYGGKFGLEKDRMDKSAVGHDYVANVEKHVSQKDYNTGFGGKFGVQTDRVDKSAVNWDYQEKIEKHSSQKDHSVGFGGKFGVQTDHQDKSAVGWDHIETVAKHESQVDHKVGFGGKFGVQTDRQDKAALGWEHVENVPKHESQVDHKIGFGGKFGVQTDRMDKSAVAYADPTSETVVKKEVPSISVKSSDLRAKFENMAVENEARKIPTKINAPRKVLTKLQNDVSDVPSQKEERVPDEPIIEPPKLFQENDYENNEVVKEKIRDEPTVEEPIYSNNGNLDNLPQAQNNDLVHESQVIPEEASEVLVSDEGEINIVDTGVSAVALYDYQAAAEDEISFDPEDIITHIEMIDKGWWRGLCKGRYGLFPSNYVQLDET